MTRIKITTSMSTTVIEVASPIDESFEIRYLDCLYCGLPFRWKETAPHQKFHADHCRKIYHWHHIAEVETHPRLAKTLSA